MTSDSPPPPSGFEASLAERNVASLRMEALLVSALVPVFWVLDWFVLPEHVELTFWLRFSCTAYGVALLVAAARHRRWVQRHVYRLAFTFSLLVAWSIAVMCWLHEGYESPYYAGLNLLILGMGFLFSWGMAAAISVNLLIYAFYMAPLLAGLLSVQDFNVMLSNQFFLISTIVITIASQHHRLLLEKREFLAKQAQKGLLEEVQALATTDWLTGLHNRRNFFLLGEQEIGRSQRYRRPLCAIMLDIDHFKRIHDSHGHAVGDQVIQTVAQRILAGVRQQDIVGRYGGEEFTVLLPETDLDMAREKVAERLRRTMDQNPVATAQGPLRVTVSAGVAVLTSDIDDLLTLLTRADSALYVAKRSGRNRVRIWLPEMDPQTDTAGLSQGAG